MKLFILLVITLVVVVAASASFPATTNELLSGPDGGSLKSLYKRFTQVFPDKEYSDARFAIFEARVQDIFSWNEAKSKTYTKGINFFTDLTLEERLDSGRTMGETKANADRKGGLTGQGHGGLLPDGRIPGQLPVLVPREKYLANAGDATTCDLTQFQTAVKDQGSCGSCYAFGTLAAAEASHFLWSNVDKRGVKGVSNSLQMSEQNLIECCNNTPYEEGGFDSNGCGGGGVQGPADCMTTMGAIPSNIAHPYISGETATTDNSTCAYRRSSSAGFVESWFMPCDSGDETCVRGLIGGDDCEMFKATAIKTSIQVIDSFRDYSSGVYSDPECPNDKHNHAVAIVGFGTDTTSGMDYWIVRNSWGPSWGDGGYIKMERGVNLCCVACENLIFQ